jgi:6-phosphogluconolactonase (cycloisomerase 2 family)
MVSRNACPSCVVRSTFLAIASAFFLSTMGILAAQRAELPAELEVRIDRLIQQLSDVKPKVREEATAALIQIGTPAAAKLKLAVKDATPERSRGATDILNVFARAEIGLRFSSQIKRKGLAGAVTVVLSSDGKFLYVPGHMAGAVNVFRRNAESGRLEHLQTIADAERLAGTVTLRLSTNGKFAVASSYRSKSVTLFSRDENTGELEIESVRSNEPDGELKLEWPIDVTFSPDDKFVYAVDDRLGAVVVFQIEDGKHLKLVETFVGPDQCLDGVRGITAHPNGKSLYASSFRAATLVTLDRDPMTGKLSVRQVLRDEQDGVHGLTGVVAACVSRDGNFVYTTSGRFTGDNAVGVYQVGADGTLKVLQEFIAEKGDTKNFPSGANGITIAPDGKSVYVSGTTSRSLACFDRDPENGKLSNLKTLQTTGTGQDADLCANGIEVSSDGKFLYLAIEDAGAISVFERIAPKVQP